MGVLEIRRASVGRANLPGIVSVNTNINADMPARALAGLGQSFVHLRDSSLGLVKAIHAYNQVKDDDINDSINCALNDYQRSGAAFNLKAMDETIGNKPDDAAQWEARTNERRVNLANEIREKYKLDDDQWEKFQERTIGFDSALERSWHERARRVNVANAVGSAEANMTNANNLVANPFADQSAWINWQQANDSCIRAAEAQQGRALSDDEKQGFYRKNALAVFKNLAERKVSELGIGNEELGIGKAHLPGASFDTAIEQLEKADVSSFLAVTANVTGEDGVEHNIMGDALKGVDLEHLRSDLIADVKRARDKWLGAYGKNVVESFNQNQNDLVLSIERPTDGDKASEKAYYEQVLAGYKAILKTGEQDLQRFAPTKLAVAKRAMRDAEEHLFRIAHRSAPDTSELTIAENDELFSKAIALGDISHGEARAKAEFMLRKDLISVETYNKVIKYANEQVSPLMEQFLRDASARFEVAALFPKVTKWNADVKRFAVEDANVAGDVSDLVWRSEEGDKERLLYSQFADAISAVARNVLLNPKPGESDADLVNRANTELDKVMIQNKRDVSKWGWDKHLKKYEERERDLLRMQGSGWGWEGSQGAEPLLQDEEEAGGDGANRALDDGTGEGAANRGFNGPFNLMEVLYGQRY